MVKKLLYTFFASALAFCAFSAPNPGFTQTVNNNGTLYIGTAISSYTYVGAGTLIFNYNGTTNRSIGTINQRALTVGGNTTLNVAINTVNLSNNGTATVSGIMNLTGGGALSMNLGGGGTVNFNTTNGSTAYDRTINSTNVGIGAGSNLSTTLNNLLSSNITNRGVLNLAQTETATAYQINKTINNLGGWINLIGDYTVTGRNINGGTINLGNSSTLQSNANYITNATIQNPNQVLFTGGTNTNTFTGAGTLYIQNSVINNASITQNAVYVYNNSAFRSDVSNLNLTAGLINHGNLQLTGNTASTDIRHIIDGAGLLYITGGTVTNGLNKNIAQNSLTVNNGASFSTNVNNLTLSSFNLYNNGTLTYTGGYSNNNITGSGNFIVNGSITHEQNKNLHQNTITINSGAQLTAHATDLVTTSGITNNSNLIFTGGTNTNTITGNANSMLAIEGGVVNTGSITQNTINISHQGALTSDVSKVLATNANSQLNNDGTLTLTSGLGGNVLQNHVRGIGSTVINGNIVNTGAKDINQLGLTVNSGSSFSTNADNILLGANGITNNGTLTYTNGSNNASVKGTGNMVITGAVTNNLGAKITQNSLTVNSGAALAASADDIVKANIINNGGLTFAGGTNNNVITGTGDLYIFENFINNNQITQASLEINTASSFSSDISSITISASDITNNGNLVLTANHKTKNTLHNNIVGGGDLYLTEGVLTNASNTINQRDVYIENGAQLITNAGNIATTTNQINNNGILTFAGGNSAHNIIGTGNVEVRNSGTPGETIIFSGDNTGSSGYLMLYDTNLQIEGQQNLTTSDLVYIFGTEKLIITNNAAISNNLNSVGGNVTVQSDYDINLSGSISGIDFIKEGDGDMYFDMTRNHYSGNTVINGGTLTGSFDTILGNINGTGNIVMIDSTDTMFDFERSVNITGDFTKTGISVYDLNHDSFSANSLHLTDNASGLGGVYVNGTMNLTNALNVGYGNFLGGTGSITAGGGVNISSGAYLSAGNSIGALNINGTLNMLSGSTNFVEVGQLSANEQTATADLVNVTGGNININPDSSLIINNIDGTYFIPQTIDIMVTDQSLAGQFDTTVLEGFGADRINYNIVYLGDRVSLTLSRLATSYKATVPGLSFNQTEVSAALDTLSTGFDGPIADVLLRMEDYIYGVTPPDYGGFKNALDEAGGIIYANAAMLPYFNAKKDQIYDRVIIKAGQGTVCPNCADNMWVEYIGSYNQVENDSNSARFNNYSHGVLVGYDRSSSDTNLVAGVMAGYSNNRFEQNNDEIKADAFVAGVYGGYIADMWDVKAIVSGTYFDNDATRDIAFMNRTAKGEYYQANVAADMVASYKGNLGGDIDLGPFAGMLISYTKQNRFTETGAGGLNLNVASRNDFIWEVRAGATLQGNHSRWKWYISGSLTQTITDSYGKAKMHFEGYPEGGFNIRGADRGATHFNAALGLDVRLTQRWHVFAHGRADISSDLTGYYGNSGIMYSW